MPNIRPVPITHDPRSSWQNIVQNTVQSQQVIAGNGLRVSSGDPNFTRVSLPNDFDTVKMIWKGDYDEFAAYNVNDVVRVVPNVQYIDVTTGEDLILGSTSEEGHGYAPLSLGLFICVTYVPPSYCNETFFSDTVAVSFPNTIPYTYQNGIRWESLNNYYPMYPEIPTSLTQSVDTGYGFTVVANNTFWQAMPFGTIPANICQNGYAKTYYIVGAESGSSFKTEYLPYSPP